MQRIVLSALALMSAAALQAGSAVPTAAPEPAIIRPIARLKLSATIKLGKTADWVAVAPDAVWVGSTGPFAVHAIDPRTSSPDCQRRAAR